MKNIKRRNLFVVLISLLLIIAIILGIIIWQNIDTNDFDTDKYKVSSGERNITVSNPHYDDSVVLVENPINFNELEKQNKDIYA